MSDGGDAGSARKMEVQAVRMTAEDYALLAGRLRARSEAMGGLPGLLRLATKYEGLAADLARAGAANDNGKGEGGADWRERTAL